MSWYGDLAGDPNTWAMLYDWWADASGKNDPKRIITPEEKQRWEWIQSAMRYTPQRHYGSELAYQAMSGMNGFTPQGSYLSEAFQGQPWLGGYQAPKFDFSKLPAYWRQPVGPDGKSPTIGGSPTQFQGPGANGAPPVKEDVVEQNPQYLSRGGVEQRWNEPLNRDKPGDAGWSGGGPDSNNMIGHLAGYGASGLPQWLSGIGDRMANWIEANPALARNAFAGGGAVLFQAIGMPGLVGTVAGRWLMNWISNRYGGSPGTGQHINPGTGPAGGRA